VSVHEAKDDLERQAQRLLDYAAARGYRVVRVVKEVGSGVNDRRPKLEKLLREREYGILLVEHKDRLTRFGFPYLELLAEAQGKRIEVVNEAGTPAKDLVEDLVAVISSFAARLDGRRGKRKAKEAVRVLVGDGLESGGQDPPTKAEESAFRIDGAMARRNPKALTASCELSPAGYGAYLLPHAMTGAKEGVVRDLLRAYRKAAEALFPHHLRAFYETGEIRRFLDPTERGLPTPLSNRYL